MENKKSISKLFLICVFGYALIAFTDNINAQEGEKPNLLRIRVTLSWKIQRWAKAKKIKKIMPA